MNFAQICAQASKEFKRHNPKPRIRSTYDAYEGLKPHEREAMLIKNGEIKPKGV